jgi:hypothetical protein
MNLRLAGYWLSVVTVSVLAVSVFADVVAPESRSLPEQLYAAFQDSPHSLSVDVSVNAVEDHVVGLGALQKIEGSWRFKRSERLSGQLKSSTWQIVDGFTSEEVLSDITAKIDASESYELLFACDARACGHGSQWANRVFRQRILYGRQDLQRYRVYSLNESGGAYRIILYASARTADRQYLQFDILKISTAE